MPRTNGYIWLVYPPGGGVAKGVFTVKHEMFQWLRGLKVASNCQVYKAKDSGGKVEYVSTVGVLLGEHLPGKDD